MPCRGGPTSDEWMGTRQQTRASEHEARTLDANIRRGVRHYPTRFTLPASQFVHALSTGDWHCKMRGWKSDSSVPFRCHGHWF